MMTNGPFAVLVSRSGFDLGAVVRALILPMLAALALVMGQWLHGAPSPGGRADGAVPARLAADVAALARVPRAVGSPGHARARDRLVAQLTAMGLDVSVQRADGVRQSPRPGRAIAVSPVDNIIAVLPGRDRSLPAIVAMSHYDSVRFAPGAADAAAGTAAVLETARQLSSGPRPLRDVIILITDAEEQGLVGANMFFARHPLAARVGMVVNAEARGSRGPVTMFQTSPGNAALIDLWATNAIRPSGNSLANAVYRILPNDTDLSVSLAAGKPGLNAAFVDGQADYHMAGDTPEKLDPATLAQLGDHVLTTTRALANAPTLPSASHDAVYFDVLQRVVVRYPPVVGWALVALAFAGLAMLSPRRWGARRRDVAWGALGVIVATTAAGMATMLVARLHPDDALGRMGQVNLASAMVWPLIGLASAAALAAAHRAGGWLGAMWVLAALALAAQILMPGAAWLPVWPLLIALGATHGAGWMARCGGDWSSPAGWLPLLVGAATLALVGSTLAALYSAVGATMPGVMALAVPFAAALLGPALSGLFERRPTGNGTALATSAMIALGSLAAMVAVARGDAFSARHPRPGDLFHLTDRDPATGRPRGWIATYSGVRTLPDGRGERFAPEGLSQARMHRLPAALAPEPAPEPTIAMTSLGPLRTVSITLPARPRLFAMALNPTAPLADARLNGVPVTLTPKVWTRIRTTADAPVTLTLTFRAAGPGAIGITHLVAVEGMPPGVPEPSGPPSNFTIGSGTRMATATRTVDWR